MRRPLCSSEEGIGFYGGKFQAMMDGLDDEGYCEDENDSNGNAKKRRLSVEQVRALEKIFAVENKLEPEKKLKLARELQLQPRQIAVWFQNRRARWKTKQLEHDYATLKANYDSLLSDFEVLKSNNQSLLLEIKQLKDKLAEDESLNFSSAKEEHLVSEAKDDRVVEKVPSSMSKNGVSTESENSAVLNDENIDALNYDMIASQSHVTNYNNTMGFDSGFCESFVSSTQLNSNKVGGFSVYHHCHFGNQMPLTMLKVEESDDFLSSEEEPCSSFFSDEQAPTILNYWD